MFYLRISFNTVYKNHKPIKNKLNTCNPSRLEFSNKSPVEDKEKAEISQNLDKAVYPLLDEMPGEKLDIQGDQPEELQREDETQHDDIKDDQVHIMIKSWYSWKSRPKKNTLM